MKELGYGETYKYAHDYEQNFVEQEFLPSEISGTTLFNPSENAREKELKLYLKQRWKAKYNYE
jgi:putative ATPase